MAAVPCLEEHCRRVALLVMKAAKVLKLPDPILLAHAAYLHDLGKTNWPEEMFRKYPLEATDWSLVKAHPLMSENMTMELWSEAPKTVKELIRGHHERPGGKGYPDGLEEPGIELLLLAACDDFDNMTNERPYRPGKVLQTDEALLGVARYAPAKVIAALAGAIIKQ